MLSVTTLNAENETDTKLKQSWRWHEFNQTRGLPSNRILQMLESNSGTIYTLTDKGFAWYNGYHWHKVNTNFNINYTILNSIQSDNVGGLTFSFENVFYKVEKNDITQIDIKLDTANFDYTRPYFYLENVVFVNKTSKKESISVPTVIQNGKEKSLASFCNFNEAKYGILTEYFVSKNTIFIATQNNLYYYNGKESFKVFDKDMPKIWIPNIYSTAKGVTYILVSYPSSMKSVWRYDPLNKSLIETNINHEVFLTATADKKQNFYFAMRNGEISYFDSEGNYQNVGYVNQYLNDVKFFFFDNMDNLWVASDDRIYLCNLNERRWDYNDNLQELTNSSVNQIVRSKFDNTLWIAGGDGVYNVKDSKVIKSFKKIGNIELKGITALQEDSKGRIWIGSGSFFDFSYYYENGKWNLFGADKGFPTSGIHNIKKDRQGRLWFLTIDRSLFGGGAGAICVDNLEIVRKFDETNGLNNARVYSFLEDSKGAYWFGTYQGLQKYNNGDWINWSSENVKKIHSVKALAEDKEGKIWFGGDKGSLRYILNDKLFSPNIFNDKINIVNNLIVDDINRLWILSKGLFLYSNNNKDLLVSYTKNAGYRGNFAWSLLYEKDSLLIGSFGNGYTTMYLNYNNDKFPKIIITDKAQNGDKFDIKIAAMSYYNRQNSEDILIRYKLDDTQWSEWSTIRNITLKNLSFGKHIITFQAANFFGEVSKTDYTKEFIVVAPFYLSPDYIVPIFILLSILVWSTYNNYKRKKEARIQILELNISLENKVIEQTAELTSAYENLQVIQYQTSDALEEEKMLNEMKSAFISSVSHEYRTPLTVILSSTYLIEKFVETNKAERILDTLLKIRSSVSTLTKFVDDSLTMTSVKKADEETRIEEFSLNRVITNSLEEIPNKDPLVKIIYPLNIDFKLHTNYSMLKNILYAILSNSIKFNKNHNTINIEFISNPSTISIRIIDKGIGMTAEDMEKMYTPFYRSKNVIGLIEGTGLGLSIAQRSADEIGARIECQSKLNEGTSFTVVLSK